MKILVFSDSHGYSANIVKAIDAHGTSIDAIVHLGDGTKEIEIIKDSYPGYMYCCVGGNSEASPTLYTSAKPVITETLIDFDGKKFFLTHGHKYDVKYGYERLIMKAEEKEADIVLFGHTHRAEDVSLPIRDSQGMRKTLRLFNPGSITFNHPASYGVIHITNGVIVTNIATL